MVKTGLIGNQLSSKWCHFSTIITLFNQVIHHNDKVKPKKLSGFTLNYSLILTRGISRLSCTHIIVTLNYEQKLIITALSDNVIEKKISIIVALKSLIVTKESFCPKSPSGKKQRR